MTLDTCVERADTTSGKSLVTADSGVSLDEFLMKTSFVFFKPFFGNGTCVGVDSAIGRL